MCLPRSHHLPRGVCDEQKGLRLYRQGTREREKSQSSHSSMSSRIPLPLSPLSFLSPSPASFGHFLFFREHKTFFLHFSPILSIELEIPLMWSQIEITNKQTLKTIPSFKNSLKYIKIVFVIQGCVFKKTNQILLAILRLLTLNGVPVVLRFQSETPKTKAQNDLRHIKKENPTEGGHEAG